MAFSRGVRAFGVVVSVLACVAWRAAAQPCFPGYPRMPVYAAPACPGVDLFWFPLANPRDGTTYRVYRGLTAQFTSATRVHESAHPGSGWRDLSGFPGRTYWYWLVPCVYGCCGDPSLEPVRVRLPTIPETPTLYAVTLGTWCGAVRVEWFVSGVPWREELYRSPVGSPEVVDVIASFEPGASPGVYFDRTAARGVTYEYWLRRFGDQCASPPGPRLPGRLGEDGPFVVDLPDVWYGFTDYGWAGVQCYAGGADALTYQWRREGVPLVDDGRISGATTDVLTMLDPTEADIASYDVVVTSACGSTKSNPSRLELTLGCLFGCRCDYNRDGGKDGADYEAFFYDWEAGMPCADWNLDGGVDGTDMIEYVELFGSCDC